MPDLKISQLPVASATTGAELFPIVQGGVTKQIALNAVRHIGSAVFDASGNLAVDTNTLFVDSVNNAVGIGTTTPLSSYLGKLAVEGNISAAFGGKLYQFDATNSSGRYMQAATNSALSIGKYQAGGDIEQMRLDTNGNLVVDTNTLFVDAVNNRVGVGTASPVTALQVNKSSQTPGDTTTSGALLVTNTLAGNGCIEIGSGSPTLGWIQVRNLTSATFYDLAINPNGGNLGLGVTPSAWDASFRALQIGSATPFAIDNSGAIGLNYFYDGAYKYVGSSTATLYSLASGQHRWFTAPSGTAGNAISFTQRLQVDGTTTAGQTALMLWDVDNGTLERVTVGAADSGGTGFKVLRIPN